MVSPAVVRSVVTATRAAAVLFALTAGITVSVDLIYAVGIGIAAAAVISLRSLARAAGVHREELPGPAVPGDDIVIVESGKPSKTHSPAPTVRKASPVTTVPRDAKHTVKNSPIETEL